MSLTTNDAGAAAQLIAYGLQPKLRPAADLAYAELLERHRTDVDFRELVERVADGLGLSVLDASSGHGLVLAPVPDSVFAQRLSDYRANLSVSDRLLHGLIHVGIAAYCYPTPSSLLDEDVKVASVQAVERFLRDACSRLSEQHGDADPDLDQPETEQAWRAYLRRQPARDTGDGRIGVHTTSGMIKYAFERLVEGGFAQKLSDLDGGTYRLLNRYRIEVRDVAATAAYRLIAAAAEV